MTFGARIAVGLAALLVMLGVAPGAAIAAGTAASITATEGQQLTNVVVDSVSSCNIRDPMIDWGDGTPPSTGAAFEAGGGCDISGSHTYTEEGSHVTDVSYTLATGASEDTGKATVADAAVQDSSVNDFMVSAGSPISGVVANWSDPAPEALSSYSATIDWGDGHSTAGTITGKNGYGTVSGSHTYVNGGRFMIRVTFHDEGGSSATTSERAYVSGCPTSPPSTPGSSFHPPDSGLDVRYVEAVYHDILGRAPSVSDVNYWTSALAYGVTRNQFALSLLSSNEYRTRLIASDYARYLHRYPSGSEIGAWLAFLGGGASDEVLIAHVLGSGEYYATQGDSSPDGFLSAMYCDTVFRSIDQFNQNNGDYALAHGGSRTTIASGVLGSGEYLRELVNGFYLRYLRRAASAPEQTYFASLIQGGETDEQVIASLLASPEYFDIFNPQVVFVSTLSAQANTITTTLSRYATLKLIVLRVVPSGHAADTARLHTKLVGVVDFGRHHKGAVRLRWGHRVHGKRLKPGRYILILKAYRGRKLVGVTNAIHVAVH